MYKSKPWPTRWGIQLRRLVRGVFASIALVFFYTIHIIWAIILLTLFLPFVVILWIPWTWFPSSRPRLWISRTKKKQVVYGSGLTSRSQEVRDAFAWYGKGVERHGPRSHRFSSFCKGRCWEIYEVMRDSWRTVHRQGLQLASILAGLILIAYQAEILGWDFSNENVS